MILAPSVSSCLCEPFRKNYTLYFFLFMRNCRFSWKSDWLTTNKCFWEYAQLIFCPPDPGTSFPTPHHLKIHQEQKNVWSTPSRERKLHHSWLLQVQACALSRSSSSLLSPFHTQTVICRARTSSLNLSCYANGCLFFNEMPRTPAARVELLCTASLAHKVLTPDRLETF